MSDRVPEGGSGRPSSPPDGAFAGPFFRRVTAPLQSFLEAESASGVLLLAATAVALVWANGPWRESYDRTWETVASFRVGSFAISESLRGWIGEGLMSIFFLVVALEIKREVLTGELRDRRTAVVPFVAAVGGMVAPAVVFLAIDAGHAGAHGWGMAMPTDIAFALGILALAAPGTPPGLKALLLGLAIVDDLLTIVVIAVFYSRGVSWPSVGLAAAIASLVLVFQRLNVRATSAYASLGVGMWLALHGSGLSPTLSGVALGLLTPAVPLHRPRYVSEEAHRIADATTDNPDPPDADAGEWLYLAELSREAVSPLARLENQLRPWAVFFVVPVFALANAGVVISVTTLGAVLHSRFAWALIVARVVGKPAGIGLAIALAVRSGVGRLPAGVTRRHVIGMGAAAGIPFTVSLFIAQLSLPIGLLGVSTLSVLVAAVLSAAVAVVVLRSVGTQSSEEPR